MVSLKHKFTLAKADGPDETVVKPTDWNAQHDLEVDTDGVFLGRPIGAGPGPVQEMPITVVIPAGVILAWAGNGVPVGSWYICDGTLKAVDGDAALYAAVGDRYKKSGDPVDTFRVPDLNGRVIAGIDHGANRLTAPWMPSGATAPGQVGGLQTTTLTKDQLPAHDHDIALHDPGHTHETNWNTIYAGVGGTPLELTALQKAAPHDSTDSAKTGITITVATVGKDEPSNNLQPTMVLQYVIKR